jgi:hypothetical protein
LADNEEFGPKDYFEMTCKNLKQLTPVCPSQRLALADHSGHCKLLLGQAEKVRLLSVS